jgi:hypothetical protein
MTPMSIRHASLLAVSMFIVTPLFAQFLTVRTPDLRLIYYDPSHEYVIPHLVRTFENSLEYHRRFFNYSPDGPVNVLLEDFDDYGYAGATSVPFNYLRLGIEPYRYDFDTAPTNERFNWVMNHELLHIVASDRTSRGDRFFRSLFGGKVSPVADEPLSVLYSYWTNPRKYSPRWYHEGLAVFMETWMAGGIGRALGGWDEMVFRTMIRDSSFIYDIVGLESEGTTIDFQVGANSYLYGTRFVSYCGLTYGPEKVLAWCSRTDSSAADFSSAFAERFGTSLEDAWADWTVWERQFQKANLDSIRRFPVTHGRRLSKQTLGSLSRAFYDPAHQSIYAAVNYPGQLAHIAAIDARTGEVRKICDVETPALYSVCSLAYDPEGGTLFYTTNNSRDWRHLYAVSVGTRASQRLITEARIGDLAFSRKDRVLWGVRHSGGISTIVRIPPPYTQWYAVLPLDYGKDIFDLDISPDGTSLVGSLIEISGRQSLVQLQVASLMEGKGSAETLLAFENNTSPQNFTFSADGHYLYGSSYYTGVSNLFRYDRERRVHEVLTNAETGLFRPVPMTVDTLCAFEYTGTGFVPVAVPVDVKEDLNAVTYLGQRIVDAHPVVMQWTVGSPKKVDPDSVITFRGEYNGFSELQLQSVYPIIGAYKDYAAAGVKMTLSDPLQLESIEASVAYTPSPSLPMAERFHANVKVLHWPWKMKMVYNRADFYDLFGPTKVSRKGYGLGVEYTGSFLHDRPRTIDYTVEASAFGGLDHVPEYQNISASYDRIISLRGSLDYMNLRRSLGAVEYEQGVTASLAMSSNYVRSSYLPRFSLELAWGFLLPLDHSSIWLRASGGQAIGERDEPFARFYLGGFGNNWVDHQDEHRYREMESFPGVELNSVGASTFLKGMMEWTLPPLRFRRVGVPTIFCTWARLALFSSVVVADPDHAPSRVTVFNLGGQVDFRLVLFWRLESMLSVGYALAAEQDQRISREFMLSLKIL